MAKLNTMVHDEVEVLRTLAHSYGLQTQYDDVRGQRCVAPPESLVAVLQSLGAPISKLPDAPLALKARHHELSLACLEPVVLAWDGLATGFPLQLSARKAEGRFSAQIIEENGQSRRWDG